MLCDEDKLTSPKHQTRCFGCHLSPERKTFFRWGL